MMRYTRCLFMQTSSNSCTFASDTKKITPRREIRTKEQQRRREITKRGLMSAEKNASNRRQQPRDDLHALMFLMGPRQEIKNNFWNNPQLWP